MSWEDQGRQYHGWFGDGKAPPRPEPPPRAPAHPALDDLFDPENLLDRIDAIGHAAIAHFPASDRKRGAAAFGGAALDDLRTAMTAWIAARHLDMPAFADRFLGPLAAVGAIDSLRAAAEGARTAVTHADLSRASAALAAAMQAIGLDRWSRFLRDAAERADAATKPTVLAQADPSITASDAAPAASPAANPPPGRYVADKPESWIGKPSVGTGECVPLVRAATGAPPSSQWRQGVQVQGNTTIRPGTAIATFGPDGHYEGHAAIYLGQDEHGIQVIDQWNNRDNKGHITSQQTPSERTLPFNDPRHSRINRGDSYHVVE